VISEFGELLRARLGHGRMSARPEAVSRRLDTALSAAAFDDPEALVRALAPAPDDSELFRTVADAVANHETAFFRDEEQLRGVIAHLAAPRATAAAAAAAAEKDAPVRILSAGCATGEEVYSLAMLALDGLHLTWGRRIEVVGADVSAAAVAHARAGVYRPESLMRSGTGPAGWAQRFLRREEDALVVRDLIRSSTRFEVANLVVPGSLEHLGTFDVVVCRNVLIYFDAESVTRAVRTLVQRLRPGGALHVAPAELGLIGDCVSGPQHRVESFCWFEPEVQR
jgi:chemotaxis protein methyltransferase CheR